MARYLRFRVLLEEDGWHAYSDRLSIEEQLVSYTTRRLAVCAMRELEEAAWARHLFGVDGP